MLSEYCVNRPYIGRFAPSPSGELHFGSLVCALASYLDAKAHHGCWLLRIEDIDPPREQIGASERIIASLRHFGLESDAPIVYQSQRGHLYQQWIDHWLATGEAYYCYCTRQQIKALGPYYTGVCRRRSDERQTQSSATPLSRQANRSLSIKSQSITRSVTTGSQAAVRLNINLIQQKQRNNPLIKMPIEQFTDILQGEVVIDKALCREDFIIKRRDQLFAYNLAVTIDDIAQEVSTIVRGSDLLELTGRQLTLYQRLGAPPPYYLHLPLVLDKDNKKLSKQNHAQVLSLDPAMRYHYLHHALLFLGQPLPLQASLSHLELLQWAIKHWCRNKIPKKSYFYEMDHCYTKQSEEQHSSIHG